MWVVAVKTWSAFGFYLCKLPSGGKFASEGAASWAAWIQKLGSCIPDLQTILSAGGLKDFTSSSNENIISLMLLEVDSEPPCLLQLSFLESQS